MPSHSDLENEVRSMRDDLTELKSDVKHVVRSTDSIMESLAKVNEWKDGDGADKPGVNTRLDRLERFQAVILFVVAAAAVATIGILIALVFKIIQTVPTP